MSSYIIEGGTKLHGSIRANGNKNAALPCIAASLLTSEPVVLSNIPNIEDVNIMLRIVKHLGGVVDARMASHERELHTHTSTIKSHTVPQALASQIRASFLFAGPLLARTGKAHIHPPGGDVIGRRRLDTHLLALKMLGAEITLDHAYYLEVPHSLRGTTIFLDETSVTATENTLMAAVTAYGRTIIENAASEPHVQDLCRLLNAMGGRISGIGSNVLIIDGVPHLHGAHFQIGSDYMEVGSFIGLAAATGSNITIEDVQPHALNMIDINYRKLGIEWECEGRKLRVKSKPLSIQKEQGGGIPYIADAPWPGFPPDLISIMVVVATQAQGVLLINEKLYESRMFFVDKLISMGAQIILCDPHRAVVSGPTQLRGTTLSSPDVRAGMALVIAALCASGRSVINNIYQIERGYEGLVDRLSKLGARIAYG